MICRVWVTLFSVGAMVLSDGVAAWRSCPPEEGGGICPDDNTCCPTSIQGISACITKPKGPFVRKSVCCDDDGLGETGCGPDYQCASSSDWYERKQFYCELQDDKKNLTPASPLRLPRYRLGRLHQGNLKHVHSLLVEPNAPHLAYYSSMSSLDAMDAASVARRVSVLTVVVVIHGSGRNADDYLSCAVASIPKNLRDSTLVLVPRFLAPDDGPVNATDPTVNLLRWDEHYPIAHTWRYGADAINTTLSSYQAMDVLVEQLNRTLFPKLERIVVAGHSAGGQFTHRWALTSSSRVWGGHYNSLSLAVSLQIPIRVVVANPRSFCYLDGQRYVNGTLRLPEAAAIEACPDYNTWEWGLDSGGPLKTPYKDRALKAAGGATQMAVRYSLRDVVYIAGEFDTLPVFAGCEDDDFQGLNRRQRSELFFESLNALFPLHRHRRFVAPMTPHDHCLIFQSDAYQHEVYDEGTVHNEVGKK